MTVRVGVAVPALNAWEERKPALAVRVMPRAIKTFCGIFMPSPYESLVRTVPQPRHLPLTECPEVFLHTTRVRPLVLAGLP